MRAESLGLRNWVVEMFICLSVLTVGFLFGHRFYFRGVSIYSQIESLFHWYCNIKEMNRIEMNSTATTQNVNICVFVLYIIFLFLFWLVWNSNIMLWWLYHFNYVPLSGGWAPINSRMFDCLPLDSIAKRTHQAMNQDWAENLDNHELDFRNHYSNLTFRYYAFLACYFHLVL